MKKFYLLTKTLLVAALLMVGANAWAGWSTVYSNNYESASTFDENLTFSASGTGVEYKACQIEDGVNHYLKIRENARNGGNGVLSLPDYSTYNQYEMSFKIGFYTSNSKSSSFQIRNGATSLATFGWGTWTDEGAIISYTIGSTKQDETLTATKQAGGTRASDTYNSIVKWYTFTITGNSTDDKVKLTVNDGSSDIISNSVISNSYLTITSLYVVLGNAHAEIGLDDMQVRVYSDAEIVSTPTFDVAYAGANRTVTITPGVSSASNPVTTYYTIDGSDPTSSSAVYSSPLDIAADCTVKAISISSTDVASAIVSQEVTVGKLKLVAPTFTKTGYAAGKYTISMASNQSGLAYPPASYTNYYSIDGGDAVAYSAAFELNEGSTVTGYVAATNYTNSDEVNLTSAARPTYYATEWTQDYRNVTSAAGTGVQSINLSDESFTIDGVDFKNIVSFNNSKTSTVDEVDLNTNVGINTNTGVGLRCNSGNSGIIVNNTNDAKIGIQNLKVGDYIVLYVTGIVPTASYGCTLQEGMSTWSEYYFLATETSASINLPKGTYNYVYTVTVLSSTVSATIGAAGYASFSSTYALDFSGVAGLEAYIATGGNETFVNMEQVDDAAAGTGLVLKGDADTYNIPIVASATDHSASNKLWAITSDGNVEAAGDGYTNYVLAKQSGNVVFAPVTGANTAAVSAGQAALCLANTPGAHGLRLSFGGDITGTDAVEAAPVATAKKNGAYLENGQVVYYKNDMKFNAAGARIY